jgi:hypothetical protein
MKTAINGRDIPLSAKVGTKIRRQQAVAQSVQFACELKATGVLFFLTPDNFNPNI